jgi:large subunit ribosomal protein L33
MVRLISMAMTGYYRTMQRPRAHQPLSMLKYDPVGTRFPCRHWQE